MAAAVAVRPSNVRALSNEKKIEEALLRGAGLLGGGMAEQLKAFFTPVNLGITVGTLVAWAVAHIYGVGEAFDLLVLVAGVGFVGWGFWDGFRKLVDFAVTAIQAQSEQDLNRAALLFRDAVIQLGINTLLVLLLKKPVAALSKPGRITVIKNLRARLLAAPPPPTSSGVSVEIVGDLKPGTAGITDSYGNIKLSKFLSMREQMKTGWHEEVHSWASPKSALLRQLRAQVHDSMYQRLVFFRYLEEAAAETRSLVMEKIKFGTENNYGKQVLTGMKFPLGDDRYAILSHVEKTQLPIVATDIATQGRLLGSIIVEGHLFNVYHSSRKSPQWPRPQQITLQRDPHEQGYLQRLESGSNKAR